MKYALIVMKYALITLYALAGICTAQLVEQRSARIHNPPAWPAPIFCGAVWPLTIFLLTMIQEDGK